MRRWRRRAVSASAIVVLLLAGYATYAVVVARRPVALPTGQGAYAVGRRTFEVTGAVRDPLGPGPDGSRCGSGTRLAVARGPGRITHPVRGRVCTWPRPSGGWRRRSTGCGCVRDATPAAGRFPLVVLLPGLGFAAPQYQAIAETLVGRGFVVVGVTPTYSANLTVLGGRAVTSTERGDPSSFEGGHGARDERTGDRLLGAWVADAELAVRPVRSGSTASQLSARTVYVGHSFGGAAALQTCSRDSACAGAVDLDGTQYGSVVNHGLRVPMLLVGHEDSCIVGVCRPTSASDRADRAVARRLAAAGSGPTWRMAYRGTQHFGFTDYAAYNEALPLRMMLALGPDDTARRLAAVASSVSEFARSVVAGGQGVTSGRPMTRGAEPHLLRS